MKVDLGSVSQKTHIFSEENMGKRKRNNGNPVETLEQRSVPVCVLFSPSTLAKKKKAMSSSSTGGQKRTGVSHVIAPSNSNPPLNKRCVPSKAWCFTYNNYTVENLETLEQAFILNNLEYVFGQEVGDIMETPHLQGYIKSTPKIRPIEKLKLPFSVSWRAAKGDTASNLVYCTKEGTYRTNMLIDKPFIVDEMYGWQLDVINDVQGDPDRRTIIWIWSEGGGLGKSALIRYLIARKRALIVTGAPGDMKYQIVNFKKVNGASPMLIIMNIPRRQRRICYVGLEEMKDGVFASPKYESSMHMQNWPHIIVMANMPPVPEGNMSADRFKVYSV